MKKLLNRLSDTWMLSKIFLTLMAVTACTLNLKARDLLFYNATTLTFSFEVLDLIDGTYDKNVIIQPGMNNLGEISLPGSYTFIMPYNNDIWNGNIPFYKDCYLVTEDYWYVHNGKMILDDFALSESCNYHITLGISPGSVPSGPIVDPEAFSPSYTANFVLTNTYKVPLQSISNDLDSSKVSREIVYKDGLGRPVQMVQWKSSPSGRDIVQHIEYDRFGRDSRKYLPYIHSGMSNGAYKSSGGYATNAFYSNPVITDIVRTNHPYAETIFENSPFNRILEQGAPGAVWQPLKTNITHSGRTVKADYGTNAANDVRLWTVTPNGANGTLYYQAGKLYQTVIKDENWTSGKVGTVEEYRDTHDKVLLKRAWNIDIQTQQEYALDTYYVYDALENLRYVIPPGYIGNTVDTASADFKKLIYAYVYDSRSRLVEKKIPGKGWEWIVYNQRDRPVLTQDAVQRDSGRWSYAKYDVLDRITETGIHIATYTDRMAVQTAVDSFWDNTQVFGEQRLDSVYTNQMFPMDNLQPLVVNYYDDYGFEEAYRLPYNGTEYSTRTKALPTGTKVYRDDGTAPLLTVGYYDDRARLIQGASQNHLGGTDYVTNTYSFTGELLTSKRVHKALGDSTVIFMKNEYDHTGRLLAVKHKINNQDTVILAENQYNEIGQLKAKSIGGNVTNTSFHTSTSYTYNERGWMTENLSNEFKQYIHYNTPNGLGVPQFNGNISEIHWGRTAVPTVDRYFYYHYDALNRLKEGHSPDYMLEQVQYDDRGNITELRRADGATDGTTSYSYQGNQLQSLSGAIVGSYSYDANGNALTDRTGMNFGYNYLNLPDTAWNGAVNVGYQYDALGNRVRKTSTQTGQRDYVGSIEYGNNGIELIHTGEGIAFNNGGTFSYRYNVTDHLGNVRVTLDRDPNADTIRVLQTDDYYPFGKQHVVLGGDNKYLYNGKEIQNELNDQYYYGARFYDAEIGRWNVADPMAEVTLSISPYAYVGNNPIFYNDPTGMVANPFIRNTSSGEFAYIPSGQEIPYGWEYYAEAWYNIPEVSVTRSISDKQVTLNAFYNNRLEQTKEQYRKEAGALFMGYPMDVIHKRTQKGIQDEWRTKEIVRLSSPATGKVHALYFAGHGALVDANWSVDLAVGGVSAGIRYLGSRTMMNATKGEISVYRVFGGDARAQGFSWTTVKPTSVKDFRNVAGLPSGGASGAMNTADFMIKGKVNINSIIKSRSALPLDGNIGGLPELIIDPKNVRLIDFKVLKP